MTSVMAMDERLQAERRELEKLIVMCANALNFEYGPFFDYDTFNGFPDFRTALEWLRKRAIDQEIAWFTDTREK